MATPTKQTSLIPMLENRPTKRVAIAFGGYLTFLLLSAEEAAPIIAALTRAQFYKKNGYGADAKWIKADESPEILLIPDSQIEYDLAECVTKATEPTA